MTKKKAPLKITRLPTKGFKQECKPRR